MLLARVDDVRRLHGVALDVDRSLVRVRARLRAVREGTLLLDQLADTTTDMTTTHMTMRR